MRDVQRILGALTSPVRREILALIWDRELPAGEIAAAFNVKAPTVSQHLSVLREAGLVTMTAQGNFRRYRARQDVLRSLHDTLSEGSAKWTPADDIPERALAQAETRAVVIAQVDVGTDQPTTFRAFTDPEVYTRWMGVPVHIDDGRFACTLEWGTRVVGVYEHVDEPNLIALRWDFEDDNIPIPGGGMIGYLRFAAIENGCHVEVHQIIDTPEHAEFIEAAWTLVLGRLKTGGGAASDKRTPTAPRSPGLNSAVRPDAPTDRRRERPRRPLPSGYATGSLGLRDRTARGAAVRVERAGLEAPPRRRRRTDARRAALSRRVPRRRSVRAGRPGPERSPAPAIGCPAPVRHRRHRRDCGPRIAHVGSRTAHRRGRFAAAEPGGSAHAAGGDRGAPRVPGATRRCRIARHLRGLRVHRVPRRARRPRSGRRTPGGRRVSGLGDRQQPDPATLGARSVPDRRGEDRRRRDREHCARDDRGESLPTLPPLIGALVLGALAYGVSILLDAYALRALGAARESAVFATAPFAGALLAIPLLAESWSPGDVAAAAAMAGGVALLVWDHHEHEHVHEPLSHDHRHVHDEHHQHEHEPGVDPSEPHSHPHEHELHVHSHSHVSDIHHRHRHRH